jgi:hypothetical protein
MTGIDAQSVPPVVFWIAAVFRRCAPAAYELVMPTANSVVSLSMPQCAVREIGISKTVVLFRHTSGGRATGDIETTGCRARKARRRIGRDDRSGRMPDR